MVALENYQQTAVDEALKEIEVLFKAGLKDGGDLTRKFLLQAPTGSGKTVMASQIVERIAQLDELDVTFVFLAPNNLQNQAKASFETYISGGSVSFLDTLPANTALGKNSIIFLNWSSINKKANNLIKDNEEGRNLKTVVQKTEEAKRRIVLIIDESHHTANSTNSKNLIETISPDVIFEISATPSSVPSELEKLAKVFRMYKVLREDVIKAGVICKRADFNHKLGEHQNAFIEKFGSGDIDPNQLHIFAALREREIFERMLVAEGNPYNPLMGIQLPSEGNMDKDTKDEISKVDETIAFLEKAGIHRDEIAVYLSGRKENLEGIEALHSPIKVVIFKVAIAVGWDCPRLKTGALLRDTKTKPFATQTLGRWMRQPLRTNFTSSEYLNRAYFYTEAGLMPVVAAENEVEVVLSTESSQRPGFATISSVALPAERRVAVDLVELDAPFVARNFPTALREEFNDSSENPVSSVPDILGALGFDDVRMALGAVKMVNGYYMEDPDSGAMSGMSDIQRLLSRKEGEGEFNLLVSEELSGFNVSSIRGIASFILTTIARIKKIETATVAKMIVSDSTRKYMFSRVVNNLARKFKAANPDAFSDEVKFEEYMWQAPKKVEVTYLKDEPIATPSDSSYAYDVLPVLSSAKGKGKGSTPEVEYLNASHSKEYLEKYQWVFKNGDKGDGNFAISYDKPLSAGSEETVKALFYPDWIVYKENGGIELHETKSGAHLTSAETLEKHKAAVAYCRNASKELGFDVSFGIVNVEEKSSGVVIRKAKMEADTLDPKVLGNWEPLL